MNMRNGLILVAVAVAVIATIWVNVPNGKDLPSVKTSPGKQSEWQKKGSISPASNCLTGEGKVRAEKGYCAPNFTLQTMDGNRVELYKNDGKPSVINFWASWCEPCRKEMPDFQQAYEKYKGRVNFLMVNETAMEEDEEAVYHFLKENRFTFPVLLDRLTADQKTVGMDQYGVLGVPMTFVVDANGVITHKKIGMMTEGEIEQLMQAITK
ncbi:TlpA family protein disulfide reductase [Lihuaxuella thermophila]|uniref:Thiol-disulfide isomerase or thioredoxin n=1 Tax=Lihuaxuella thermophila TaxID=1173111 RepID=A0A1H8DLD7_9BACL|nr:TlpA disulfide reductase family protein [Lihuaxuella thermophila]SEN07965.1 Thiol-disulfide isomerase or thioredoxin [Lihuaxuella thermophila]